MYTTLRRGDTDTVVRLLKQTLNFALTPSPKLLIDNMFDMNTGLAVRRFQVENNLVEDEIVGPKTWRKLLLKGEHAGYSCGGGAGASPNASASVSASSPALASENRNASVSPMPGMPDTTGLSNEHKYALYLKCIRDAGQGAAAEAELAAGNRVILGLRIPTNTRVKGGLGQYDDRFIVLHNQGDVKTAVEFVGNTDPSSRYEHGYGPKSYGNDANRDGKKDLGRIPAGAFKFHKTTSSKYGNVLQPSANIRAERDINHDGVFDDKDIATDQAALNAGQSMLFHKGGNSMTGSAGCQTMPPATFEKFWKSLGSQKSFLYVLIQVK